MTRYALITPSHAPDFERCRWMCRTVDRFVEPCFTHYLVIDRKDLSIFRKLATPHRRIIESESLLPWWLFRIPFFNQGCISLKSLPVRNWILQQLLKFRMAEMVDEEVLNYIDSDTCFIRPFKFEQFERSGLVRLFSVPGKGNIATHYPWHRAAASLLGLPPCDYFGARYIGNFVTWRKSTAKKLFERIETVNQESWLEALSKTLRFSEYILYGVFSDQILKSQSGHYDDSTNYCLEYWEEYPMNEAEEKEFISRLEPFQFLMMVSAKSKIPIERVAKLIDLIN